MLGWVRPAVVLASLHAGKCATLTVQLQDQLALDVLQGTRAERAAPAALGQAQGLGLEAWAGEELQARAAHFVSAKGVLGEEVPHNNQRHPFWRFEGEHVRKGQAYACSAVLFFAGLLCSAGGIGGGGIYVAVLMTAAKLDVCDAVPLSKAVVFIGSIAAGVLNSRKLVAWETKRETAIDYNICRLVVPGSLSGTLIGVILNRHLPSAVILMVLTLMLVSICTSVAWTTWQQYKEEREEALQDEREAAAALDRTVLEGGIGISSSGLPNQQEAASRMGLRRTKSLDQVKDKGMLRARRLSGCRRPSMNAPDITKMRNKVLWLDIILLTVTLCIVIACGVLRFHVGECHDAGLAFQHRACNHPALFWLGSDTLVWWVQRDYVVHSIQIFTILVPLSVCTVVEVCYARTLIRREAWRGLEVLEYGLMAVCTGCLAGLVGIGGGLIFSPFFLLMGVHPSVAVASSSTCVIFTAASTTLQYLLTDRIIISLTVLYGAVNLVASYAGTSFVHCLQDRFWSRKSYVSFIVGLGVFISTVLSSIKLCLKLTEAHGRPAATGVH